MLWDWVKQGDSAYNTTKAKAEDFFGISKDGDTPSPRLSSPTHSQFSKSVALLLRGVDSNVSEFIFPVNPEEFNYNRPERVRVTKTLGEPFIDEFGIGIPTVQLRGTTGWRTRPGTEGTDGSGAYRKLHRDFFDQYFKLRQNQISNGGDPDIIKLLIVNSVDNLVFSVVPTEFRLLRSKTRPLLYQYDLNFSVIEDLTELKAGLFEDPIALEVDWQDAFRDRWPTLAAMIDTAQSMIDNLEDGYQGIKAALTPAFEAASEFIGGVGGVLEVLSVGAGHVATVINTVADKVDTVTNAIRSTQGFINDLPLQALVAINNLESAFHELTCYMNNGARDSWLPDFTPVEGATDCAITRRVAVGTIASNPSINAVEWVSNLAEAARNTDISSAVGFANQEATASGSVQTSDAPVVVDQVLGEKIDTVVESAANLSTFDDVKNVLAEMVDVMGSITFDATKVNNEVSENLIPVSQTKTVVVEENDSLQSIALRELGDASRWREIVALNNIIVETPVKILHPERKLDFTEDLVAGDSSADYGRDIPSEHAMAGDTFLIRDVDGLRQWASVKSVSGQVIEFNETFSRIFRAPIEMMRYVNRANLGVYDYTTTLSAAFSAGTNIMGVAQVKDIYPGFVLYIQGQEQSQTFTVKSVNYLEKTVKTEENSTGFPSGADVQIYDTENRQHHLEPGLALNIPVTATNTGLITQTDRQIYGVDIALDGQGFLSTVNGDLDVVIGLDNLKQALRHRLICPYESIIVHPEYGCALPDIIGKKNGPANTALARATVIEALNYEPRINRIINLEVRATGDIIAVGAQVESVDKNTTTDLNFVV